MSVLLHSRQRQLAPALGAPERERVKVLIAQASPAVRAIW